MRMWFGLGSCLACLVISAGCNGVVSPEGAALLKSADAAYRRADDTAAIASATQFLQMHPRLQESAEAYYIRGLSRRRMGETAAATADLEAAADLAKRKDVLVRAHLALGELAYEGDDMAAAEKHYLAVTENCRDKASPEDEALYRLGSVLQRQGRWSEANKYYSKLGHLFPGSELAKRGADRIRADRWSIQAGAFAGVDAAQNLERKLRTAGLAVRRQADLRGGKRLWLVLIGSYATYKRAEADLERIKETSKDAFIAPVRW